MLPPRPARCILAAVAAATLGACHPGGQAEHTPAAAPEAQAVDAGAPVLAAVQNARAAIAAGDPVAAFNDVNLGIGYAVQLVGAEFDALPRPRPLRRAIARPAAAAARKAPAAADRDSAATAGVTAPRRAAKPVRRARRRPPPPRRLPRRTNTMAVAPAPARRRRSPRSTSR